MHVPAVRSNCIKQQLAQLKRDCIYTLGDGVVLVCHKKGSLSGGLHAGSASAKRSTTPSNDAPAVHHAYMQINFRPFLHPVAFIIVN